MAALDLNGKRRRFEPLIRKVLHFYWRFARGMTFGVRAVVLDEANRVFLVKHSYVSGWHLPGGGVEVGETAAQSLERELVEEGNIVLDGEPRLHGLYFNRRVSRRDHVAVYVVREFHQTSTPTPNHEIIDCGFFDVGALPPDTTRGSRARIREVVEGVAPSPDWS
jgi:8-oxo-dGTP pyrophosphatase MutT (NUDIX family)